MSESHVLRRFAVETLHVINPSRSSIHAGEKNEREGKRDGDSLPPLDFPR